MTVLAPSASSTLQSVVQGEGAPLGAQFELAVKTVQFLAVDAVEQAKSGHPGAPMGLAGIAVELFTNQLRFDPAAPKWANRDRFVLSCGHASALLYSVLHLSGYPLSLEDLRRFRQMGSRTPGHPEYGMTEGVETTTGPLGQGIGNSVGFALARELVRARLPEAARALVDYRVFCLASDGDLMEGVAMEASSFAGHLGLSGLIVVYDDNEITIDGAMGLASSEDVAARYTALGWAVQKVDGHDPAAVRAALEIATAEKSRPCLIIARTVIGKGAPTKAGSASSHGAPLGPKEVEGAKAAAGWPSEPFYVPADARALFAGRAAHGAALHGDWQSAVAALSADARTALETALTASVPADLLEQLVASVATSKDDATRVHSGHVLQRAAELVPALISGSADLTESTKAGIERSPAVKRGEFAGRNLHYGIREHAMGSVMNGLALSGSFIPAGSTFLIFSDYMRPPIRLASLMEQQAIYVFTHDSVFVGEDGPTHQPIEQLWTLRLVPGLHVVRPADQLETAAAWAHALTRRHAPTALSLTRQKVPTLSRPAGFDPATILRGGYALNDEPNPELVLIATGSEVQLAVGAREQLAADGVRVRVVSMPCVEAFLAQPREYQDSVLGRGVKRASVEAGRTHGWLALVGLDGLALGIDEFGASAPAAELTAKFGLTVDAVTAKLRAFLRG